jgi:hypothetical protein
MGPLAPLASLSRCTQGPVLGVHAVTHVRKYGSLGSAGYTRHVSHGHVLGVHVVTNVRKHGSLGSIKQLRLVWGAGAEGTDVGEREDCRCWEFWENGVVLGR